MIDIQPHYLEIIKVILRTYIPECEVRVFGSRVNGDAKPYSDLDLAIVGEQRLERKTLNRLQEALAESELPMRVDVVDWHGVSDSFRRVIEKKYEVIPLEIRSESEAGSL